MRQRRLWSGCGRLSIVGEVEAEVDANVKRAHAVLARALRVRATPADWDRETHTMGEMP